MPAWSVMIDPSAPLGYGGSPRRAAPQGRQRRSPGPGLSRGRQRGRPAGPGSGHRTSAPPAPAAAPADLRRRPGAVATVGHRSAQAGLAWPSVQAPAPRTATGASSATRAASWRGSSSPDSASSSWPRQLEPDIGRFVTLIIGLGLLAVFVVRRDYGFLVPGSILTGIGIGLALEPP